jgi:hypothetical protein
MAIRARLWIWKTFLLLTFSAILSSVPFVMSRQSDNLAELVNEILQSEGPYIDDEQKTICRVRDLWLLLGKLLHG